jgi:hypothetical protein
MTSDGQQPDRGLNMHACGTALCSDQQPWGSRSVGIYQFILFNYSLFIIQDHAYPYVEIQAERLYDAWNFVFILFPSNFLI